VRPSNSLRFAQDEGLCTTVLILSEARSAQSKDARRC
jgi:hypothetical protein